MEATKDAQSVTSDGTCRVSPRLTHARHGTLAWLLIGSAIAEVAIVVAVVT